MWTCLICRFAQKANHRGALREDGNADGPAWSVSANARSQPAHQRSESMRPSGVISNISVTASEVRVSRARSHRRPCSDPEQPREPSSRPDAGPTGSSAVMSYPCSHDPTLQNDPLPSVTKPSGRRTSKNPRGYLRSIYTPHARIRRRAPYICTVGP